MSESTKQPLSYEETLAYSQNVRRRIVEHYTEDKIPADVAEVGVVLKALKDMDVAAIEHKRNSIEEGKSNNSRHIAEAMAEFLKIQRNENPFKAKTLIERPIPEVDITLLGEHTIVPGEMDVEVIVEDADDFIRRMDEKRRLSLEEED